MGIDTRIQQLKSAWSRNEMSDEILIDAIDELKDPADVRRYFDAYVAGLRAYLERDQKQGRVSQSVRRILSSGKTLGNAAEMLARDRFSTVLGRYRNPDVHKLWGEAVVELYPGGRLKNMFELYAESWR